MVWNLFPFKGDFSLGKSQKSQGTKSGLWGGLSHLGDLMFCQKTLNETMHEWACFRDQLPIAVAFWIIRMVSVEECSSLLQNLMQIFCSTCLVILNAMATQYTYSLNGIYHPHWLVQWRHHCSHMCIPVHSSWLPGYIRVAQTNILTLAGLFLDRHFIFIVSKPILK